MNKTTKTKDILWPPPKGGSILAQNKMNLVSGDTIDIDGIKFFPKKCIISSFRTIFNPYNFDAYIEFRVKDVCGNSFSCQIAPSEFHKCVKIKDNIKILLTEKTKINLWN